MSKRLQVLLDEAELAEIRKIARRQHLTTATWVRQALRAARRAEPAAIAAGARPVTDAEVFQEILHRYAAIDRRDAIQPAFDAILGVVDEVFAITLADVQSAKSIVLGKRRLPSRDALHAAVMGREGATRIMSFDIGFDGLPGITRLGA